jgi:hypothetical protein
MDYLTEPDAEIIGSATEAELGRAYNTVLATMLAKKAPSFL